MIRVRPLLPSIILLSLLSGCLKFSGPPGDANLNLSSVDMIGITESSVRITASGAWTLDTAATWLSASPSSGTGDATVKLTVDPSELVPGEHSTSITLKPLDFPRKTITVNFAFPRLRGSIVMGPGPLDEPSPPSAASFQSGPGTLFVGLREPASAPANFFSASATDFSSKAAGFRSLAADVASRGGSIRLRATHPHARVAVMEVDDMRTAREILERDPNVRYVEPEGHLELLGHSSDDEFRDDQWALDVIGVDAAWGIADGTGVRVAVIDAGFHPEHTDLKDNVDQALDFASPETPFPDRPACGTHGDHVAGIVAAVRNTTGVVGIAPGARMSLLNVGNEVNDTCPLSTGAVVSALEWAIGEGGVTRADIVNMSFGGGHTASMEDAVKAAYAAGITLVAAAGNSATSDVLFPAAYPQVIAVSATGEADEIASYSTTGPQIFLGAPGGNEPNYILSTIYDYDQPLDKYQYGAMAGTSMASPAVAAVAAIVKSANADLSPLGIAGVLADTSEDLLPAGRDDTFGYGRVDAQAAALRANDTLNDPHPTGLVLQAGSLWEYGVPVEQQFDVGYIAGGTVTLKVGSDDNLNGILEESGEYYGELNTNVAFDGPYHEVEIAIAKQPGS